MPEQATAYLEGRDTAIPQYHLVRKALPSGAAVMHTTEGAPSLNAAEGLANYTTTRTSYGSYHDATDYSGTLKIGRFEWQMFGEGTGGNRWAYHHAFCCRTTDWTKMPEGDIASMLVDGAEAVANYSAWLIASHGIAVPARRITKAQYHNQEPGFISHGELDPSRRSDPGADFPWDDFLSRYEAVAGVVTGRNPNTADLPLPGFADAMNEVAELYLAHRRQPATEHELAQWRSELHRYFYGDKTHESPLSVLQFINWTLHQETRP